MEELVHHHHCGANGHFEVRRKRGLLGAAGHDDNRCLLGAEKSKGELSGMPRNPRDREAIDIFIGDLKVLQTLIEGVGETTEAGATDNSELGIPKLLWELSTDGGGSCGSLDV